VKSFFFVATAALYSQYSQLFCELLDKYLLVSELHIAHIIYMSIFGQQFSVAESCVRSSLFMQFLSMTIS